MATATKERGAVSVLREGRALPGEFLATRRRTRILDSLSELIAERGYAATHISDIVKAAGMARKTFYDTFAGKRAAADALVDETLPAVTLRGGRESSIDLFAIEVAAATRRGLSAAGFAGDLGVIAKLLEKGSPWTQDGELLSTLPPGRHGLKREFVRKNQRTRLLVGFAASVVERGFFATRIGDITRHAAVSRRTFYEHFENRDAIACALLQEAGLDRQADVASGLGGVAVEIAAAWFTGSTEHADRLVDAADDVLYAVVYAVELLGRQDEAA